MQVYPDMNIRFPEGSEAELVKAMQVRAKPPWRWQERSPHGKHPDESELFFRRDAVGGNPPCLLCLFRKEPGNFVVGNIVPDPGSIERLTVDQYVNILRDFDNFVAEPAAVAVGGMTSIDTTRRSLEDYFSPKAVRLLERFCMSANAGDLGSHPTDQRMWLEFLLHVCRAAAGTTAEVRGCTSST